MDTPLSAATVGSTIAILDDEPQNLEMLRKILESQGFAIEVFSKAEVFFDYLDQHVVQVLLIDVSLYGNDDVKGIEVAKECATRYPDSVRVCLSREAVAELDILGLMEAMNPSPESPNIRVFEAFGDKHRPSETANLVTMLRKRIACSDDISILMDETMERIVQENWKTLLQTEDTPEPTRQVVEIVKRLSLRPYLGQPNSIHLANIGGGRSRTVVLNMNTFYGNEGIPYKSVIKVGFPALIDQECQRYVTYVPRCLAHGRYPSLEGWAESRNLKGLSYGRLGGPDAKQLPPTLRDELRSMGRVTKNAAKEVVNRVFRELAAVENESDPNSIKTLLEAYRERFRILNNPKEVLRISEKFLKPVEKANYLTTSTARGDSIHFPKFKARCPSLHSMLQGGVNFTEYGEAICHGDLHLDNVITPNGIHSDYSFIDFAHTGPHPCFIDHIVLELGVRFQLGDKMLSEMDESTFIDRVLALEWSLANEASAKKDELPVPGEMLALRDMIYEIRAAAAGRWGREPSRNYFGGLGLTLAAALTLPLDKAVASRFGIWFTIGSLINMSVFELDSAGKMTLDLWKYSDASSDDQKLLASAEIMSEFLRAELARFLDQGEDFASRLSNLESEISVLNQAVDTHYPEVKDYLENLIHDVSDVKGDPQSQFAVSVGLPFCMFSLGRKIQVPQRIAGPAEKIVRKLFTSARSKAPQ